MLVTIGRVDFEATNDMTLEELEEAMIDAGEKNKRLEQEERGKELIKQSFDRLYNSFL